jgi:hypothetical protein
MALGSTENLTEISTENIRTDKAWLARKADILIVICESIV